jgi:hypothetical protein
MYMVKNLTTENDYTSDHLPVKFLDDGLVGLIPVYDSVKAAKKAWPGCEILAVTLQRRAESVEVKP